MDNTKQEVAVMIGVSPAPRIRVQIENQDGTWTELPVDDGISLEVDHLGTPVVTNDPYCYLLRFNVSIHHQRWHDMRWLLSKRTVDENNKRRFL